MNETIRQLMERKSVRAFTEEPITPEEEEQILEAAVQAPTAGNQQLYTILKITDPQLRHVLAELCDHQPFIEEAKLCLIFVADCRRWLDIYRAAGCEPRPAEVGDLLLAMADSCIAAQNAVTAAESLGIGSCYIGDVLEQAEEMRKTLCLPEDAVPAAMLVFGRPTQQQRQRIKPKRFCKEAVVRENVYSVNTPEEIKAFCRERAQRENYDFEREITAFWKRKYESDFSREMSRSAAVYLEAFRKK